MPGQHVKHWSLDLGTSPDSTLSNVAFRPAVCLKTKPPNPDDQLIDILKGGMFADLPTTG